MFTTRIAAFALAALTLTAGVAATSSNAQAGNGFGVGLGVGLATGALIGAAAGTYGGPVYAGYGYGYRPCRWVRQYDEFGYVIGRARVCY